MDIKDKLKSEATNQYNKVLGEESDKLRSLMDSNIADEIKKKSADYEEDYYYTDQKGDMDLFKAIKYAKELGFDNSVKQFSIYQITNTALVEDYENGSLIASYSPKEAFNYICNRAGWYEEADNNPEDYLSPVTDKLTAFQCAVKIIKDALTPKKEEKKKKVHQPEHYKNIYDAEAAASHIKDPQIRREVNAKLQEARSLEKDKQNIYNKIAQVKKGINIAKTKMNNKKDAKVRGQAKAQLDVLNKSKEDLEKQITENDKQIANLLYFSEKKIDASVTNMFSDLIDRVKAINNFALTGKYGTKPTTNFSTEDDDDYECYCQACGQPVHVGDHFCAECGERLD